MYPLQLWARCVGSKETPTFDPSTGPEDSPFPGPNQRAVVTHAWIVSLRPLFNAGSPRPACRFRFCGAVLRGQLYVVGGMAAFEPADAKNHVVSDRVMRYSPSTDTWEVLPGMLAHGHIDLDLPCFLGITGCTAACSTKVLGCCYSRLPPASDAASVL